MQQVSGTPAVRILARVMAVGLAVGMIGCGEDRNERIVSIYELKSDPTDANIAKIRSALEDPDRDVRATALNALVTHGVSDRVELARDGLYDPDPFVRATAAKLLGDVGDSGDSQLLVDRVVEDSDPIVRQRAAESLAGFGGETALDGLVRGLQDPMQNVRLVAVRGLRRLDPERAMPTMARLVLEDPMWEIRVQAVRALGESRSAEVVPVLEQALRDPNEFVRSAAANALAMHGVDVPVAAAEGDPGA